MSLPWGLTQTKQGSMKGATQDKKPVASGPRKSRFQKEKEEREAKQRKAEEEAAKIYEQFVASFETEAEDTKTFVQGSSFVPRGAAASRDSSNNADKPEAAPGRIYKMQSRPKPQTEMDRMMEEMKQKEKKKGRQIDTFLEELKNKQEGTTPVGGKALEDALAPFKGSYDDGDPETTNLYVGNLAPTVTEEALQENFARFGEIYSVKIMWPRTEEERARKRNCGFVSYYRRADAEDAKNTMHDTELEGYKMIIGWGKAVKRLNNLAPSTIVPDTMVPEGPIDIEPVPQIKARAALEQQPVVTGKWDQPPSLPAEREMREVDEKVEVEIPEDDDLEFLISRLARYVSKDGLALESRIKEREIGNPSFRFLFDHESPEGVFYRWKTYSFLMGDKDDNWRTKPFQMTLEGPFWVPPRMPERRKDDSDDERDRQRERTKDKERDREREREREKERERERERERGRDRDRRDREKKEDEKLQQQCLTGRQLEKARDRQKGRDRENRLSVDDYDEFMELLKNLNASREKIKEAMGFALDNANASEEVVDLLKESLLVPETALPMKLARLYLVSDVLHNSSSAVKNASTYRTYLQQALPEIFEALNVVLRSSGIGRISALQLEEKVMQLLKVWEDWSIYPPLYLTGLEAVFRARASDLDDGETVDEAALEKEKDQLIRQAKNAGLSIKGSLRQLVQRIRYLDKYIKLKAAGKTGLGMYMDLSAQEETEQADVGILRSATAATPIDVQAARGRWSTANHEEEEGDDVDGKPLDAPAPGVAPSQREGLPGIPAKEDSDTDSDVDGRPLDGDGNGALGGASGGRAIARKRQRSPSTSDSDDDDRWRARRVANTEERLEEGGDGANRAQQEPEVKWTEEEEEDRRQTLRKLETTLLHVRDELEGEGIPPDAIEAKLQDKRTEAIKKWEEDTLYKRKKREETVAKRLAVASAVGSSRESANRDKGEKGGVQTEKESRKRTRSKSKSRSRERDDRRRRRSRSKDKERRSRSKSPANARHRR